MFAPSGRFSGGPFAEEWWHCFFPFALFHLRELSALFASSTYLFTRDVRYFGPYFGKKIAGILVLLPASASSQFRVPYRQRPAGISHRCSAGLQPGILLSSKL
jgi:hypothetical protein